MDEADETHQFKQVIGRIDLIPEKTVAGRRLIAVVIVVPPLPQRQQGQEPMIATFVAGVEALPAPIMHQRVVYVPLLSRKVETQ